MIRVRCAVAAGVVASSAAFGQPANDARGLSAGQPSVNATTAEPFVAAPYLQLGDAPALAARDSVVVRWLTADSDAAWAVEVMRSAAAGWSQVASPTYRRIASGGVTTHRIYSAVLSRLEPGAAYQYRVRRNTRVVFRSRASARPPPGKAYRFVVFGDCGVNSPEQRAVAFQVWRASPDLIGIAGDVVYTGGRISEYATSFFPIYNSDLAAMARGAPLLRTRLFFAALGNGDIRAIHTDSAPPGRATDGLAFFAYWALPLNGPTLAVGVRGAPPLTGDSTQVHALLEVAGASFPRMANYSFDYGNSHWTVLDMNPYVDWADTTLRSWLARDLEGARAKTWRFVLAHQAGFSSGRTHYHDQQMRLVADIFERGGVDMVFAGHAHTYQRTRPLTFRVHPDSTGNPRRADGSVAGDLALDSAFDGRVNSTPRGVLYIISGAGGAPLYDADQTGDSASWQPYTVRFIANVHSFTAVDIVGRRLMLRQIAQDGRELDRITVTKAHDTRRH